MEDPTGCRVAQVAMAKIRILKGVFKGRYGDDRHESNRDVMHLSLEDANEGVVRGDFEILEVLPAGMPNP